MARSEVRQPGGETRDIVLLAIDDDPTSLDLIRATLEQERLQILTASDPQRGIELIAEKRPDIVLSDLMMPRISGMDVLAEALRLNPATEVVLLTAHYSSESAVEAIQKGASDYLNKPIDTRRLRVRIGQLMAEAQRRVAASQLDVKLLATHQFRGIVGRSPAMLELLAKVQRIALHYRTVLVTGPTGSGKELVARALHDASPVAGGPFVVCNCAAIPENLVESELFGHLKGSFTGAVQDKSGLFEAAHGGTILLDEIGEMPLKAQAKLLRVVQQQEVQRVGATVTRKVNVRVIAATHRDLREMAAERTFREDLFFRLGMVQMQLPALKDRKEDLPLLLRHFVRQFSEAYNKPLEGFTRKAEMALACYDWPGNIRELEGVIGSAAIMADSPVIDVTDLPAHVTDCGQATTSARSFENAALSLDEMQVQYARQVVAQLQGNKTRAAEILQVSRATLYRLLAKTPVPSGS